MSFLKRFKVAQVALLSMLVSVLTGCGAARWEDEDSLNRDRSSTGSVTRAPAPEIVTPPAPTRVATVSSLLNDYYKDWRGTLYRFGGTTRNGIDCSAFTQQAMQNALGIPLARTTKEQLRQGRSVRAEETRAGDLVFFKTGETLNHVGVIIGPSKFMHASTKSGVTISRLDDTYWSKRVIGYRRVLR